MIIQSLSALEMLILSLWNTDFFLVTDLMFTFA